MALATKDYVGAMEMIDKAITINPSSAHAHGHGSVIATWAGLSDKSIALSQQALGLSPFDPLSVMPLAGQAGALGRYHHLPAVAVAPDPDQDRHRQGQMRGDPTMSGARLVRFTRRSSPRATTAAIPAAAWDSCGDLDHSIRQLDLNCGNLRQV